MVECHVLRYDVFKLYKKKMIGNNNADKFNLKKLFKYYFNIGAIFCRNFYLFDESFIDWRQCSQQRT